MMRREGNCKSHVAVMIIYPGGVIEISRWLSEATPPVRTERYSQPRRGCSRSDHKAKSNTLSGCRYVDFFLTGGIALLNPRLMTATPPGSKSINSSVPSVPSSPVCHPSADAFGNNRQCVPGSGRSPQPALHPACGLGHSSTSRRRWPLLGRRLIPVSYTHLTLPTIYSV